jgi:ribonuclease HII
MVNTIEYEIGSAQSECFRFCALVGGIDEVGRGPLAGPVVASCVVFDCNTRINGLNDSKKLSPKKRALVLRSIIEYSRSFATAFVSVEDIDDLNIYQATRKAMYEAVQSLSLKPEFILADAMTIPGLEMPQKAIIRGDQREPCIMAASILAKETRDSWMAEADELYPGYGFARHAGYGTAQHLQALMEKGPCPLHRRSFRPVMKSILQSPERVEKELESKNEQEICLFYQRAMQMGFGDEEWPGLIFFRRLYGGICG